MNAAEMASMLNKCETLPSVKVSFALGTLDEALIDDSGNWKARVSEAMIALEEALPQIREVQWMEARDGA